MEEKKKMKKSRPEYINVDGLRIRPVAIENMVRDAMQFEPEKNDVVVGSYLKCGSTWTLQIVSMILRKGQPHTSTLGYFSDIAYVEFTDKRKLDQLPRPRCLRMHLPVNRMQFSKGAKYIWVLRKPADCLVSLYHHTKFFPSYQYKDGNFNEFFELFLKGEVDYNGYFDHMLSWYDYRNEPNVLCITYESMKSDIGSSVLKIARHMGEEYYNSLLENDGELLKKVLHYSSFDYMRNVVNVFWREAYLESTAELRSVNPVLKNSHELNRKAMKSGHRSIGQFIRKGELGDGKATLSHEQMKRLHERLREKVGHTDIMNILNVE